jgi:hypothetical protein
MSAGTWGVILLLVVLVLVMAAIWIYSTPQLDDPPGFRIDYIKQDRKVRWHYTAEDPRALRSTGYLTRASAIRAANDALRDLEERTPS